MSSLWRRLFGRGDGFQQLPQHEQQEENHHAPDATNAREKKKKTKTPIDSFSPLQLWLNPIISETIAAGSLEESQLPPPGKDTAYLQGLFRPYEEGKTTKFWLQWELGCWLAISGLLEFVGTAASLSTPMILHLLLQDLHNKVLVTLLIVLSLIATLAGRTKDQMCRMQMNRVGGLLQAVIYSHGLKLSPESRSVYPAGKIITLMTNDVEFLKNYVFKIHDIWSSPLQLAVIMILVVFLIGSSGFYGIAVVLVCFMIQFSSTYRMGRFVGTYLGLNDGRIQFLQEMLYGIKGVKSLRFESLFHRKIEDTRTKQLSALGTWMKLTFCVFTSFNQVIPGLAAGGIFVAYYLMGYRLRADVVFPVLTYMNMLYQPVSTASLAITRQFSVRPCWIRIRDFLHSAEQKPYEVDSSLDEETAIQFRDATFKYHTKEADGADSASTKTLRIGDLDIPANRLTMVIGSTASGKSSLLQALLDELEVVSGSISRTSNMAYVSQNAWVMSGTLRQNIVFMSRFDPVRYQEVIQLCALEQDLAMFPGGDATPVGEIGNNLSGGQRARIALARAIYSDSPILLLDDPLAAVDARVADQLFEGISKLGSRTVLLITNHTRYLPRTNSVVIMKDNAVAWSGLTSKFLEDDTVRETHAPWLKLEDTKQDEATDGAKPKGEPLPDGGTAKDTVADAEEKTSGDAQLQVLTFYGRQTGGPVQHTMTVGLVVLLLGARTMSQYWFVWWTDDRLHLPSHIYLIVYLCLVVAQAFMTSALGLVLVFGSLRASKAIHETILKNLLDAPYSFFQTQPVGRIINRLSSDVESVDAHLMNGIDALLVASTTLLSSLALIATTAPFSIAAIVPYIIGAVYVQNKYRISARELKRTLSVMMSPVLSVVSESLLAADSIRAYQAAPYFAEQFQVKQDPVLSASIVRSSLDTWLTVRAELLSLVLLIVVAVLGQQGIIPETEAGLALGSSVSLARNFDLLAWAVTSLEIQLNSIERLQYYHDFLPRESRLAKSVPSALTPGFPNSTDVEFSDVCLRYPSREKNALDHVDLKVSPGERIGIIGRTGCGKSTLLSSIIRLVDITSGTIRIDGVDIGAIPVDRLREMVSTLPQEALIFEGTLRENLDPTKQHSDTEIWEALERCNIDTFFRVDDANTETTGLNTKISSGGSTLSSGQRQLMCAARTMLKKPKILLVDEPNANIDKSSDLLLQEALQQLTCTLFMISHRPSTLAWLDRIIVMEDGRIVEEGSPFELLQRGSSEADKAGDENGEGEGETLEMSNYYRRAVQQEGSQAMELALRWAKGKQTSE